MQAKRPVLAISLIALLLGVAFLCLFPDAPKLGPGAIPIPESEDSLQPARADSAIASSLKGATDCPPAIDRQDPHDDSGAVSLVVRDMADGEPVPDVRLALASSAPAGIEEVRTSMDGRVHIPVTSVEGLSVDPSGWHTPTQTADEIRQSGVLWCYRMLRVTGRVEEESGPVRLSSPASIEAVFSLGVQAAQQSPSAARPPWTHAWFRKHGVRKVTPAGRSDIDGAFFIEVPRIRDLRIVARTADRKRCGVAKVELDSRTESASVCVVLVTYPRVVGRIVGHNGKPVQVKDLQLYSQRRIAFSNLDIREIRAQARHNGLCYAGIPDSDDVRLWVIGNAKANQDGKFDVSVNFFGEGLLSFWVPGHRHVRMELGDLVGEESLGEIRLPEPPQVDPVQFRYNGVPMKSHGILAVDLSSEIGQLRLPVHKLDGKGEIDGAWLEVGRKYYLLFSGSCLPKGKLGGCLVHRGASVVEVSSELTDLK